MLFRVRATKAALAFCSTAAVGLVFGMACSVDRAGLSTGGAPAPSGGSSGGGASAGGRGGSSFGGSGGAGGASGNSGAAGGVGASGDGGASGTGGTIVTGAGGVVGGTGGSTQGGPTGGAGGATGAGGSGGAGGDLGGTGGVGTGGAGGSTQGGGTGGAVGTGGSGSGGAGTGGSGSGGAGTGGSGSGGEMSGTGGATQGGTGGHNHNPDCSAFPSGSSFVTPTDNLHHCYWVHSQLLDWTSSESTCVTEGGTLATILSAQENTFVQTLATDLNLFQPPPVTTFPPPPPPLNPVSISLGATDGKTSGDESGAGQYAWVTGETWGYTNWHSSQPDGSCNACTTPGMDCDCDHWLTMSADGTWYDRPEATGRAFVCEAVAR